MCLGGGSTPSPPPPPQLPPPLPPPPPPKPAPPPPKLLATPEAKPDIRIGDAKKSTSGQRNRGTQRTSSGQSSLSIGSNQGLNL